MLHRPVRINHTSEVAPFLRGLRKGQGWSLRQLSELSGLSIGLLSQYEAGHHVPMIGNLIKIFKVYGLALAWGVWEEGEDS